eukprot:3644492-Karenia_brevis.AAC.1
MAGEPLAMARTSASDSTTGDAKELGRAPGRTPTDSGVLNGEEGIPLGNNSSGNCSDPDLTGV